MKYHAVSSFPTFGIAGTMFMAVLAAGCVAAPIESEEQEDVAQEEVAQEDTDVARQPLVANGQIANIKCDMGPCAGPDASYHYCLYHDTATNEVKMNTCVYWSGGWVDRRLQPHYRWQQLTNLVQNNSKMYKNMGSNKCLGIVNNGGYPRIEAITCNASSTEQAWNEYQYWTADPDHQYLRITHWSPYYALDRSVIRAKDSIIAPGKPVIPWGNTWDHVGFTTDWRPTLAP